LDADYYAAVAKASTVGVPEPRSVRAVQQSSASPAPRAAATRDRAWLRLVERAVGGWAPTLRGSLVLVGLYLCAAILLVLALGVGGVALAGGLAVLLCWLNAAGRLPRA
jgi:hypothetical protein